MTVRLNEFQQPIGAALPEWQGARLPGDEPLVGRYGFTFEGIFRQAVVTRGRSRDTAWYSIIDSEYPALHKAYEQWLSPSNFDEAGHQIDKLGDCIASISLGAG